MQQIAARRLPQSMAHDWTELTYLQLQAGAHIVDCDLPLGVGMTMRDRFDHYLVGQAVAAGAELRDGTALTALDRDEPGLLLQAGPGDAEPPNPA